MELVYELISYSCYADKMISQNYLMSQKVKKCQW